VILAGHRFEVVTENAPWALVTVLAAAGQEIGNSVKTLRPS
jgi:hypothetical protein